MKREQSFILGMAAILCLSLASLFSCKSTLVWTIEPIKKAVTDSVKVAKVDTVKKTNYQKIKEAFKKDFDPLFDRLPPAYK